MQRPKESVDYYERLGVSRGCSSDDIKKAYKKMAMKYHPDKKGGCQEKFKEIQEAYAILIDPEKKRMYDQFGTTEGMMGPGGGGGMPQGMDLDNLFENLFGIPGMGGMGIPGMAGIPGMNGRRGGGNRKAPPKNYELHVTLEEIFVGKTIPFRIKKKIYKGVSPEACTNCKGSGQVVQQMNMGFMVTQNISACPKCSGAGKIFQEKDFITVEAEVQIPVPQGLPEGNQIVIKEKGDELPGMESGDVHFVIRYKPHSIFSPSTKEPLDLDAKLSITLYEALYGFKKQIRHLDGGILEISHPTIKPLCTNISEPLMKTLKNEGLKFQTERGDLHLLFTILLPQRDAVIEEVFQKAMYQDVPNIYLSEEQEDFQSKRYVDVSLL